MFTHAYLDANAAVPVHPQAWKAYIQAYQTNQGWVSPAHTQAAAHSIAQQLGCKPEQLYFTSGGTESAALALWGSLHRLPVHPTPHVVTTALEHDAVMKNLQALAREHHIALSIVSPNRHGTISPDAILAACQPHTQLVSCIFASNETGILQPIHAIAKALQTRGIPMHTDATQAIGKTQIDLNDLPVDMLSFSGHKLGAPFGIGALYVRAPHLLQTCFVDPLTTQYTHYHHPAAISALAAALKHQHHPKPNPRDAFEQQLAQHHAIRMLVAGQNQPRLYNTSCIRFVGIPATALLMRLDLKHIYASAGSACHSGIVSPSSVLLSMGFTQAEALETIRFSFPPQFSPNHVHTLVEHIVRECHAIQYHHAPSP